MQQQEWRIIWLLDTWTRIRIRFFLNVFKRKNIMPAFKMQAYKVINVFGLWLLLSESADNRKTTYDIGRK